MRLRKSSIQSVCSWDWGSLVFRVRVQTWMTMTPNPTARTYVTYMSHACTLRTYGTYIRHMHIRHEHTSQLRYLAALPSQCQFSLGQEGLWIYQWMIHKYWTPICRDQQHNKLALISLYSVFTYWPTFLSLFLLSFSLFLSIWSFRRSLIRAILFILPIAGSTDPCRPEPRPPTVQALVYYAVRLINLFIFFSN